MATQVLERPVASAEAASAPRHITYEEFLDWLDEDTHADWVDGEIIMHSPVSFRHQKVRQLVLRVLAEFVERHGLGELADDPFQMKIGPDFPGRAPDILFVAKAHLDRLKPNVLDGPADLVVEIISPDSRGRDRGDKHYEYERGGIPEYWLIDPERNVAEFYLLEEGRYVLAPIGAGIFRSRVLEGLWLRVEWLWQDPLPPLSEVLHAWDAVPAG